MANPSAVELIQEQLIDDRRALSMAVERVPAHRRSERPHPDRWSVAEIIEHVAMVESRTAAGFSALVATAALLPADAVPTPTPFDRTTVLDRSTRRNAPEFVAPLGQMDFVAAWEHLQHAWAAVDAAMVAAAPHDLATISRDHPVLGMMDGYQWLNSIGGHELRHAAQILEIADVFGPNAG